MEVHPRWTIFSNIGLQSTIPRVFYGTTTRHHMAHMGVAEMQVFSWQILQNRIWSSDRLQQQGWDHNLTCPLCRCRMETTHHLLAECRLNRRIWSQIATWTAQPVLTPSEWRHSTTSLKWWTNIPSSPGIPRNTARRRLLVIWELWKERIMRVFRNHGKPMFSIIATIKDEAAAWIAAGPRA